MKGDQMTTTADHSFMNHVMDADSHEMSPAHMWSDMFGPVADEFIQLTEKRLVASPVVQRDVEGDFAEISESSVWEVKGPAAPSAIDFSRRHEVMDVMGIDRQLVFPGFGQAGMILQYDPDAAEFFRYDPNGVDRKQLAQRVIDAHNEWSLAMTKQFGSDRVRHMYFLIADTLESMMTQAEVAIDGGMRAIQIPIGTPPAGLSPADRALDPFWRLCAEANVPVLTHIGSHFELLRTTVWNANVPEFASVAEKATAEEFRVEPYSSATMQFAPDNYLCAMILGGVFERHPTLRFGAIEMAAHWVGPLAEKLDMWVKQFSKGLVNKTLTMRPSEYLARNVRATPFFFEPIDYYIERYPQVASSFAYGSDYPHNEGGRYSKKVLAEKLSKLGDDVLEDFFVNSGKLLLPV
jgi:predicted TIM-barrel fold metal-dependent hydrolase